MSVTRVLLIDDDRNYQALMEKMLRRAPHDYNLDCVDNYAAGLETMLTNQHDIFLVDYRLQNQSGLDLIQEATQQGVTTPMVIITAQAEPDTDLNALEVGATDYVEKTELSAKTIDRVIRYALEHARVLRERRESEQRYRYLIENAFDGILITNQQGAILLANNKIREVLCYPEDTLAAMNVTDLLSPIDEDAENKLLTPGRGTVLEYQLHCADEVVDVEVSAKDVGNDQLQFIIRDISDRRAAMEERDKNIERLTTLHHIDDELSRKLRVSYVMLMAMDAAIRLSLADAGFVGLVEDDKVRLAQALGHYSSIQRGEYLPDLPLIQRLMTDREARLIADVEQDPDYMPIQEDTRAQMLFPLIASGELIGILNLETRDPDRFTPEAFDFIKLIASRVAVAIENARLYKISQDQLTELQELYAHVSSLEQLKTDMIRIASHDLRNPVGVILGYIELIQQFAGETLDPKLVNFLGTIERSARRMEKITTDILSLERIESSFQSDKVQTLNLSTLVYEASREFTDQAETKNQTFHREIPDMEISVRGDSAQLRQAIGNFISNAIKYTPEGGSITVKLETDENDAVLRVIDTGFGIPEDQQDSLFQAFSRVDSAEIADIQGTGLGLYLIKNIVKRHEGAIIFESVYGDGSTFGFRLPIA